MAGRNRFTNAVNNSRTPPPLPEFEIFPGIIPHISVVYVYPVFGSQHDILAQRFVLNYISTYPRIQHDLIVVCNGGEETPSMKRILGRLKYKTIVHDDTGWDIGAYQFAAREIPCDLMIFMGGSSLISRKGWIERIINAHRKHGDTLYGSMQNNGDLNRKVWPHIRTTGFWMNPKLLNKYPKS